MSAATLAVNNVSQKAILSDSYINKLINPLPLFELYDQNASQRKPIEAYIKQGFWINYHADLSEFMPYLLTMHCFDQPSATVGIRFAANSPLFLEHYLTQPVQAVLSHCMATSVARDSIVEIGNLVATKKGASQLIFLILAALLEGIDIQWTIFTGTPQVQKILSKLGFEIYVIGKADSSRLHPSIIDQWGTYYDTRPSICAICPATAVEKAKQRHTLKAILSLYQKPIMQLVDGLKKAYSVQA